MPFRLIRCAARLWRDADGRCGDAAEEEREHQWEWRAHRTSNVSWLDDAATTHTMPQEQSGLCRWALTMSRGSVTKSIKRTEGPKAPRAVAWCFDALGDSRQRGLLDALAGLLRVCPYLSRPGALTCQAREASTGARDHLSYLRGAIARALV